MDQAQEIMHMNKLLEVEDLSFKLQLEDAMSFPYLSRSDVFCYLLKNCFMVLLATSTFYPLPGLTVVFECLLSSIFYNFTILQVTALTTMKTASPLLVH